MNASPSAALYLSVVVLCAALGTGTRAQAVWVDFGATGSPSMGATTTVWNDSHPGNTAGVIPLRDSVGSPTGMTLTWAPGAQLVGANSAGTSTPLAGSALAGLNAPASATRDSLFGSNSNSVGRFTIAGLNPAGRYDFTFSAARLGATDVRETSYEVAGTNAASGLLNVSNNESQVIDLLGLQPNPAGELTITLRAGPGNTNANGWFYIGLMRMTLQPGGPPAQVLGWDRTVLPYSVVQGGPPTTAFATLLATTGTNPTAILTAVDPLTGTTPSWLQAPPSASAGSAVSFVVDVTGLATGRHRAEVTADSPGFQSAGLSIDLVVRRPGGPWNLLFYGNSYTIGNGTAPALVRLIAEEAGFPAPNVVARLAGGQDLAFHLGDPGQAGAITNSLSAGEHWDFVVMQGHSQEATISLAGGNQAAFIANAVQIQANVRAHSPAARSVLFQTWARAWPNGWYPSVYPTPYEMHGEIRTGYQLARAAIEASSGPGTGRVAPVGDAFANTNFRSDFYTADTSHQTPIATLLAAQIIFTSLYEVAAGQVRPLFGSGNPLVNHLATLGLGEAEWNEMARLADEVAYGPVRPWAGSGEDFTLRVGSNAIPLANPRVDAYLGETLSVSLDSPIGERATTHALLFAQLLAPAISPPSLAGFPEIHLDPLSVTTLFDGPLPTGGFQLSAIVPSVPSGVRLRMQGVNLVPSPRASNPSFTTTNAVEVTFR